ncbi:restriction endonuclease [Flavobacteriaceae bacterium AU392]|nr:restriction endonuclease [Flavobacteriaceae bacterium]RKM86941.1 restriction endonuclease [Flavobacteriaceae bacterium AU392]
MGSKQSIKKSRRQPGKVISPLSNRLSEVEWGEFKIDDLFEVLTYKKRFDANKVTVLKKGKYPYVVRMGSNNGQKGFINENVEFLNEGNTISFGQDTATMYYQETPYFTGDKIKILKSKFNRFSKNNAQFFISTMMRAFSSFSWGSNSFSVDIIKEQTVSLPVKGDQIDFDIIETILAELEADCIKQLETHLSSSGLKDYELTEDEQKSINEYNNLEWKEFKMGILFERLKTKKLPFKAKDLPNQFVGDYTLPCLTSSFNNQGLNYFASKNGATILKNVISIPSNSDIYRAYFQSNEFTVLSDAYAIQWIFNDDKLFPNQYLFTVQCINKVTDLPIYSYKNKLGGWNVVKDKDIQLPIKNGKPDYEIMDTLISAIKKLIIKDIALYIDRKKKELQR